MRKLECRPSLRLPLSSTESILKELSNLQPVQVSLIESTPIDSKQCKMATLRYPILSKVLNFVLRGWPDKCPSEKLRPVLSTQRGTHNRR